MLFTFMLVVPILDSFTFFRAPLDMTFGVVLMLFCMARYYVHFIVSFAKSEKEEERRGFILVQVSNKESELGCALRGLVFVGFVPAKSSAHLDNASVSQ